MCACSQSALLLSPFVYLNPISFKTRYKLVLLNDTIYLSRRVVSNVSNVMCSLLVYIVYIVWRISCFWESFMFLVFLIFTTQFLLIAPVSLSPGISSDSASPSLSLTERPSEVCFTTLCTVLSLICRASATLLCTRRTDINGPPLFFSFVK